MLLVAPAIHETFLKGLFAAEISDFYVWLRNFSIYSIAVFDIWVARLGLYVFICESNILNDSKNNSQELPQSHTADHIPWRCEEETLNHLQTDHINKTIELK